MRAQAMYHLDLDAAAVQGAQLALLPGDPLRSRMIADRIATLLVTDERSAGSRRLAARGHLDVLSVAQAAQASDASSSPTSGVPRSARSIVV